VKPEDKEDDSTSAGTTGAAPSLPPKPEETATPSPSLFAPAENEQGTTITTSEIADAIQQLTQQMQQMQATSHDNFRYLHNRMDQQARQQAQLAQDLNEQRERVAISPLPGSENAVPTSIRTTTYIRPNASTVPTRAYTTTKRDELPKMPIKMKEFSGHDKEQNVQSWVDQLTTIKRIEHWSDDIIIKHCAMLLSDSAQRWYLTTGHSITDDWKKFSKELIKRFTLNINPWMATRYTQDIKQRYNESCRDFMDRVQRELRLINIDSEERVCEVFLNGARDSVASGIIRSIGREAVESKELVEIACRLEMAEKMERDSNKRQIEKATYRQAFVPTNNTVYNAGARVQLTRNACFICHSESHRAKDCPKSRVTPTAAAAAPGPLTTPKKLLPFNEWKATLRCTTCGASGHSANFCPRNRQATTTERQVTTTTAVNTRPSGVIRTVTSLDDESDSDQEDTGTLQEPIESDTEKDMEDMYEDYIASQPVLMIAHTSNPLHNYIVVAYVHGKPVHCTIDSGATCSCIDESVFISLPAKSRALFQATTNTLSTANGGDLLVTGTCNIPVRMKSNQGVKEMDVKFHVVKKLTAPCLLGTDFANRYATGLMWPKNKRHLVLKDGSRVPLWDGTEQTTEAGRTTQKKSTHRVMLIRLEHDITLKASSAISFPGAYCFSTDDNHDMLMAQGVDALGADGVLFAPTVHKANDKGKRTHMVLQVTNTGTKDVTYPRGQVIGTAEPVSIDLIQQQEKQDIAQSQDVHEKIVHDIGLHIEQHEPEYSALRTTEQRQRFRGILSRFSHLFDNRVVGEARQGGCVVAHTINTGNSAPIRAHPYRQSPAIEASIQKEIDKLLADGVIEHSNSPWASPIVMVPR
jgi:hypothetical protein